MTEVEVSNPITTINQKNKHKAIHSYIYNNNYLQNLFNTMSYDYEMTEVATLGYTTYLRKKALKFLTIKHNDIVCDMMCGPGNVWNKIINQLGSQGKLIAVDFSKHMIMKATQNYVYKNNLYTLNEDACNTSIPSGQVDSVFCGFGLKTLSAHKKKQFVREVNRILKPGGKFVFIDIVQPRSRITRSLQGLYLQFVFPLLIYFLVENPKAFASIYDYLSLSDRHDSIMKEIQLNKIQVKQEFYFFDSISIISGQKIC
jgi:ubiquinone/menaquinone biosynthesis C-methylase UbiE